MDDTKASLLAARCQQDRAKACRRTEKRDGKDPHKQIQGAVSRARGQWFEGIVETACAYYRARGVADIEKTPEPMRPTKSLGAGRFIAYYTSAAQADFKGTLQGGRTVNFEAKHTDQGRMQQSRITDTQSQKLDNTAKMGGICFVLCSFGEKGIFRIPWALWKDMKRRFGRLYFTAEDVPAYQVRFDASGVLLFLDGLEQKEL